MLIREVKMSFNDLDLRELDKGLSPKEKEEWNDIYSSYRGSSILTKRVSGVDSIKYEGNSVSCLVSIDYRVKVLIPAGEVWYDKSAQRPDYVLKFMSGAEIDYVIIGIDRIGECAIASRRLALESRRRAFKKQRHNVGDIVPCRMIASGRSRCIVEVSGYDFTLSQRDMSYCMITDLRSEFFTGERYKAKIMEYEPAVDHLAISMKEVEPHPYDGVEIRHPINSRRVSKVTAKFGGNVFCRLDGNLDCLCTYSSQWSDSDFSIGDRVVIAVSKVNPVKKQVFGKVIAKL